MIMSVDITSDDYRLNVELGDRVRRHLIRHFSVFLRTKIAEHGFTPDDPLLFDQDRIEAEAWRLAGRVIDEVQQRVADDLAEAEFAGMLGDFDPAERIRERLAEQATEQEREFLEDSLGGLDGLIELASGHFPEIR
jgi:hypothetical protein